MCGLLLVTDQRKSINRDIFKTLLSKLALRGPDSEGLFFEDDLYIGHRRLSIQDVSSAGHQPMMSANQRYVIAYNGEIYNFKELSQILYENGINLKSKTDTEVLVNLFQLYGIDCLKLLQGMFSFVVYDKAKKEIYAVRDRFGIKPLYYGFVADEFFVASELKAIVSHPAFCKNINPKAVESFFLYRYIPAPETIWKDCYKLEPGTYLTFNSITKKIRKKTYYKLEDNLGQDRSTELKDIFHESVKKHLVSDVTVSSFLSGGVDSSLVTAYAKRINPAIKTFTIGFEPLEYSEHSWAERFARESNVHNEVHFIKDVTNEDKSKIFEYFDEPFADSSMVPTYLLSKISSQFSKVVLSGDGGDELFSGYSWYRNHQEVFKLGLIDKLISGRHKIAENYCNKLLGRFDLSTLSHLVKGKVLSKEYLFEKFIKGKSVRSLQLVDFHTFMVDDVLLKVDRSSMANSQEVRVPFLDHTFVEAVFSSFQKGNDINATSKTNMKRIFGEDIPEWVFSREKKGFSAPVFDWDSLSNDILACEFTLCKEVGGIDSEFFNNDFYKNHSSRKSITWMLYCYEMWLTNNMK